MSPSPAVVPRRSRDRAGLARLLRDLGPTVHLGQAAREVAPALATGLEPLDSRLGGGLAPGRLSELWGPLSSGRTSLALAWLARITGAGGVAAAIDPEDALHPASAAAAGIALERLLWARPPAPATALRCCERLLQVGGFAAIWLDTGTRVEPWTALSRAAWQRLSRAAAASGTALLVSSARRLAGPQADLALELRATRPRFEDALFGGMEVEVAISHRRRGAPAPPAPLRLRALDL